MKTILPRLSDLNPGDPNQFRKIPWNHRLGWLAGLVGVFLISSFAEATMVRKMDLQGLCQRANRIFRGTVTAVESGAVEVGRGKIPTVTYRIKITENIQGTPLGMIDVTMIADPKDTGAVQGAKRFPHFEDMPMLTKGGEYLLFTTTPSRIGLSTTVGLQQGCFQVQRLDKKELVVNGSNNAGLGLPVEGPVAYADLVNQIQSIVKK